MRILGCFLLIAASCLGCTATLATGTYASVAATSGHWSGSGCPAIPGAGDAAIVPTGSPLHIANGETWPSTGTLGSRASAAGTALSFGAPIIVDAGGTLNLAGFDTTSNLVFHATSGGSLTVNGTLSGDAAGDFTTYAIFDAGTSFANNGSLTVPAANYSWNNQITAQAIVASYAFANTTAGVPINAFSINTGGQVFLPVSNSSGTGLGNCANSSLTLSTSGVLTSEVCSIAALTTNSQYYIDYLSGIGYSMATVAGTATYKSITPAYARGWGVKMASGSSFSCTGGSFSYMGRYGQFSSPLGASLELGGQTPAQAAISGCTWNFSYKAIVNSGAMAGTSGSHVRWQGIAMNVMTDSGYNGSINLMAGVSYLDIVSPVIGFSFPFVNQVYSGLNNLTITGATGAVAELYAGTLAGATCADCSIDHNCVGGAAACYGYGNVPAGFFIVNTFGTSGHPFIVSYNSPYGPMRCISWGSHSRILNNNCLYPSHHGIVAAFQNEVFITDVQVKYNVLVFGTMDPTAPPLSLAYGFRQWLDNVDIEHNTVSGTRVIAGMNIGDPGDGGSRMTITGGVMQNNIVFLNGTSSSVGSIKETVNICASCTLKAGMTLFGYNLFYNATTPYKNFKGTGTTTGGGALFSMGGVNYNTSPSKQAVGVTIWNPTYTTVQSGSKLQLIKTSSTNYTLAWSLGGATYGTAQQLVFGGAGNQYTISGTPSTTGQGYIISVTGTPWSQSDGTTSCPVNMWYVGLTGASAGQVGAITDIPSTGSISVAFQAFPGVVPAAGDTFVILGTSSGAVTIGSITLADEGSGNIEAWIDPRSLPSANGTYTDTGISISFPDTMGVDPKFANGDSLDTQVYGTYAPTNPAIFTVASDGTAPGAVQPITAAGTTILQ